MLKSPPKALVVHDWKSGLLGLGATVATAALVYFKDNLAGFGLGGSTTLWLTPALLFILDMLRRFLKDNTKE